jgi:hypothetical protein
MSDEIAVDVNTSEVIALDDILEKNEVVQDVEIAAEANGSDGQENADFKVCLLDSFSIYLGYLSHTLECT